MHTLPLISTDIPVDTSLEGAWIFPQTALIVHHYYLETEDPSQVLDRYQYLTPVLLYLNDS